MKGIKHFKNKEAYNKWVAYGNIHGEFKETPGNQKVYIAGKKHGVKHKR